jgi:hypothetical protein
LASEETDPERMVYSMIYSIAVEDLSHYASDFDETSHYRGDEGLHPTQRGIKKIKLMLLFIIPDQGESAADVLLSEGLPRIAAVRVPRGTPMYRLRALIKCVEKKLEDTYRTRVKRLNLCLTCQEDSSDWVYSLELPRESVFYL